MTALREVGGGWLRRQPPLAPAVCLAVAGIVFGLLVLVASRAPREVVVVRARAPFTADSRSTQPPVAGARATRRRAVPVVPAHRTARRAGRWGLAQMVGQTLMVHFPGTVPPSSLLARIRSGEVGGVILMGDNTLDSSAVTARITRELQAAARAGGRPGLLIATDQEGGTVKRLAGAPTASAAQMGLMGSTAARRQGLATGDLLRAAGVNVDLAPVADVETSTSSFLTTRSFGHSATRVGAAARAFAYGLEQTGTAATAKHFPGLGATGPANTDLQRVEAPPVTTTQLQPFADLVRGGVQLVMVSSAIYRSLDSSRPAILSPTVVTRVLRGQLGFGGVVISDEMHTPAVQAFGRNAPTMALTAGADILMYASSDGQPAAAALLADARAHRLSLSTLQAADARILSLKRWLGLTRARASIPPEAPRGGGAGAASSADGIAPPRTIRPNRHAGTGD